MDHHPRFLADVNGDGKKDVVGFANSGVYISLGQADGTLSAATPDIKAFGYNHGWRIDKHPRLLADINGDKKDDIVGFANDGVSVALGQSDGTFSVPKRVLTSFGFNAGGWTVKDHPRLLADVNGDGKADIVGFANDGVYLAFGQSDGTFSNPRLDIVEFHGKGGWTTTDHVRLMGDVNGDRKADIIGFASDGVRVALGSSDGFLPPRTVLKEFGYSAGGWRVSQHPRLLGDVNGDGKIDIVGFSNAGVHVALGQCDGTFSASSFVLKYFGYVEGGWRVDQHPRLLGDVNGDGKDDIVGFSNSGVHVALGLCDGTFSPQSFVLREFGYVANGWRVDQHPRLVGDVNGDLKADIVGFANSGVQVALSDYH